MADNLKTNGKKTADGEYENPTPAVPAATPTPLPLAPAVTPAPDPIPLAPAETPTATPLSYIPQQSYAATDFPYWLGIVNQEQQSNALNPSRHTAFTNEEMLQKYAEAGIDPAGQYVNHARNFDSTDPNYQSTISRDYAAGTSGGDEYWLTDSDLAYVRYCQQKYAEATSPAEKTYWHNEAEKTRARAGYSGGTDGSMYISTMQGIKPSESEGVRGSSTTNTAGTSSDLKGLLDAWQQAAMQQSNGQIDYAVAKAVADLERALADAQPQFKEQAESVDRDARQAMDNSALYAEMRGDKGGIGQEQYNSIQNTQAQNHLAVQQAQTKLATDTQRQIADLRAQGEFEKADAALEITQNYLAQLISLEQWAAEYNLSVEQFNESVRQWEASYNMEMQKLQISQNQWQAEFDAAQNQWQTEMEFAKQQYSDSLAQWEKEFAMEQALAQLKLNNTGVGVNTMTLNEAKSLAEDGVFTPESLAVFYANGYTDDNLKRLYRYTPPVEPSPDEGTWGKGYDTTQNTGGVKGSEWGYVRNNILQGLMSRNFVAVKNYLDTVAGGFSPEQWAEIQGLLDAYGFVTPTE